MAQRDNIVGGHLAGRDVNITNNIAPGSDSLMDRLRRQNELEHAEGIHYGSTIDALRYYEDSIDTIPLGLEKKLELGARHNEIIEALRAKELFAKCLARHTLSQSSQEVIAYCLGQVQQRFLSEIVPRIQNGSDQYLVNEAIIKEVVQPVLRELEGNFLKIMPQELRGMIYYLTGNCFLNWHIAEEGLNVSSGT